MTEPAPAILWPKRTKTKVIKHAEWRIHFMLDIDGTQVDAGELRFADSWVAAHSVEFGRLVAGHVTDAATRHQRSGKRGGR